VHLSRDPRAPRNTDTAHERVIRALVASDPAVERRGFWKRLRDLYVSAAAEDDEAPWDDVPRKTFQPDAFKFDHEQQLLILFEVEATSPISAAKLDNLAYFWFEMDAVGPEGWLPVVMRFDRHGTHTGTIDLMHAYHSLLEREAGCDPTGRLLPRPSVVNSPLSFGENGGGSGKLQAQESAK
jgi:hypothetical protein